MVSFAMKSYDDMFGTDSDTDILEIPLSELDEFPNHPFKVIDNSDMIQLAESIKENGVINPAIVREKTNGRYELISGHRRKRACELAGLERLRCVVKDITDYEATVLMVDSNFQRSELLPSEKAFAYKMRLDAMKHQGKSFDTETTSTPTVSKSKGFRSDELLAKEVGESRENIRRYIRLTALISPILNLVDIGKIKLRAAVILSYINENNQDLLYTFMINEEIFPSEKQADELRGLAIINNLNEITISNVLCKKQSEKKTSRSDIKIPVGKIRNYFPAEYSNEDILDEIISMLESRKKEATYYDFNGET